MEIKDKMNEIKTMYQVKSKWYYVFWGIMAFCVVSGQIYVGLGYREMVDTIKNIQLNSK